MLPEGSWNVNGNPQLVVTQLIVIGSVFGDEPSSQGRTVSVAGPLREKNAETEADRQDSHQKTRSCKGKPAGLRS
jgi:hypothetical protein